MKYVLLFCADGDDVRRFATMTEPERALLLALSPTPVVALNRAVALRHVAGPKAALDEIEPLAPELDGYHLFHAIRGELLVELGRRDQARAPSSEPWRSPTTAPSNPSCVSA